MAIAKLVYDKNSKKYYVKLGNKYLQSFNMLTGVSFFTVVKSHAHLHNKTDGTFLVNGYNTHHRSGGTQRFRRNASLLIDPNGEPSYKRYLKKRTQK